MRRYQVAALALGTALVAGCPFLNPPGPGVLSGDWSGTTSEGVDVTLTFDDDNSNTPTKIVATNADGQTATLELNNASTTINGSAVVVTIAIGDQTAIYTATLSADQNTLEGSVTSELEVAGGDATVVVDAGDLTLTRDGAEECTTDGDCAMGQVCTEGECVAGTGCATDDDCATGEVCTDGECVEDTSCTSDEDCAEGEVCTDGECVTDTTDCTDLTPSVADGQSYYDTNCASCHGSDGSNGTIGPDITGLDCLELISGVEGAAIHSSITLTDQNAADVAAYLASL